MTALSTMSLAKKPNSGGTPASENIAIAITPAYHGLRWLRPLKSSISSASKPARASSMIMPNATAAISA
jgi:hypothetical protein